MINTNDILLKGNWDCVLLNFEIAILIVTILWFFYCIFYTIKIEVQNLNLIGPVASSYDFFNPLLPELRKNIFNFFSM